MTHTKLPLFFVAVTSIAIALVSFRFLLLGPELAFPGYAKALSQYRGTFLTHVSTASIALALGAVQFLGKRPAAAKTRHRWTGRIYAVSVLLGGLSGLVLALNAVGGLVPAVGFGLLSVLWILSTAQAVRLARAGRIAEHRRWMIRSFALTFAAVTLRIYMLGFVLSGVEYPAASVYLAWICWVPNLMFAEWYLRRKRQI